MGPLLEQHLREFKCSVKYAFYILCSIFFSLPGQMEASSSFKNMSHILDLMLRGRRLAGWTRRRQGSEGVLAFGMECPFNF